MAERPIAADWLLTLYGIERPAILSYAVGDRWLSHLGGNSAYLDSRNVGRCPAVITVSLTRVFVAEGVLGVSVSSGFSVKTGSRIDSRTLTREDNWLYPVARTTTG